MYEELVNEIIEGRRLGKEDDLTFLIDGDLESLCQGADKIRKELCGNQVDLCTIINGRAGRCSENCRFCAQSSHHHTGAEEYDVMDVDSFVKACHVNEENGAHRFSIVTAGRTLVGKEFDQVVEAYKRMHEECKGIELCASHGLLTKEQFEILRKVGVTRCHANIETSRRYFPSICTTHTFEDKLACIRAAKEAGLEVCSGGIVGMGETWEDRLDMALTLAELEVDSIPLNALMPIPGTPFENLKQLTEEELLRVIAMFRFINPSTSIRLAAGRKLMKENGKKAIGVDQDQNSLAPENVITSAMKNIDVSVEEMLSKVVDGSYKGGEVIINTLAMNGVGIPQSSEKNVPPDVLTYVKEEAEKVKSGEVKVPATKEEFEQLNK